MDMECSKLNGELSKSHNGINRNGRAVRDEEEEENYVTLAKAGGRKDLLIFQEFAKTSEHEKPTPYPWVDWFDDRMPPSLIPVANEGSPYIQSDLLTWKLPPEQSHSKKHHKPLPSNRNRKLTYPAMTKPIQIKGKQTKLPTISSGPVLMKELLSMNYQKEWLKLNNDRNAEEKRKINEKKKQQEEKLLLHSMKKKKLIETGEKGKERFIMKKFMNIPPRIKLPSITTQETTSKLN